MSTRILAAACVLLVLAACGRDPSEEEGKADGGHDPIDFPDGGKDPGTQSDGGVSSGSIPVTCTGPAKPLRANESADITCTVNAGGRTVTAPTWSSDPADGVVLRDRGNGTVTFAYSLTAPGHVHPLDFVDTTFHVTVEVKDANDPAEFGRSSFAVSVLGNYWVGDGSTTNPRGIYAMASDGSDLGLAVGPAGIRGVSDMLVLSGGDIAVASEFEKTIKIFDRTGRQVPVTFDDADTGGNKLWTASKAYPRQMALSSTGELWVAGAISNSIPGIAVFKPSNGQLLRFVPRPGPATDPFIALARRDDGKMIAGLNKTVSLFDEKTYQPVDGSPFGGLDHGTFSGSFLTFAPWGPGQILATAGAATGTSSDSSLCIIDSTLAVRNVKVYADSYYRLFGIARQGDDILSPSTYGVFSRVQRFTKTFDEIEPPYRLDKDNYPSTRGIVKLRAP